MAQLGLGAKFSKAGRSPYVLRNPGAASRHMMTRIAHALPLLAELDTRSDARPIILEKQLGETHVRGEQSPAWTWPVR
jgi:hypothetical protein